MEQSIITPETACECIILSPILSLIFLTLSSMFYYGTFDLSFIVKFLLAFQMFLCSFGLFNVITFAVSICF